MFGTKHLSELVDIGMFQKDKLNIIEAPTGSGKTYFALTHIPSTVEDALHEVLYLIDTVNGKEQILENYKTSSESWNWVNNIVEEGIWFCHDETVVVMTYAKFGVITSTNPDFENHFDYIICDELHNLLRFQAFEPQPNTHSLAREGLERAVKNERTTVVALTATPANVKDYFHTSYFEVPIDQKDLLHYEYKEKITYTNLYYLLSTLDPSQVGLCYIPRIHIMKYIEDLAKDLGFTPICIWSIRNGDYPMTEEQLEVRRSILENGMLPEKYNFLIINASSETSIKIKTQIDYVIVHNLNEDIQTQVKGRVNNDFECLYVPATEVTDIKVPAEYLNKQLDSEEKRQLCSDLNLRNEQGRLYRWTSVREFLIEAGYSISDSRNNNRRYSIITAPEEKPP